MATLINTRDVLLQSETRIADNVRAVNVVSDKLVFYFDNTGTLSPSTQVVTFTATKVNTSNAITWTTTPTVPLYNAATGGVVATTETTVYMRAADFAANLAVQVTATITDGSVLTSNVVINKQQAGSTGADAVIASLTTPVATVVSANDGTGYTLPGTTTIRIFKGGVLQTITSAGTGVSRWLPLITSFSG